MVGIPTRNENRTLRAAKELKRLPRSGHWQARRTTLKADGRRGSRWNVEFSQKRSDRSWGHGLATAFQELRDTWRCSFVCSRVPTAVCHFFGALESHAVGGGTT